MLNRTCTLGLIVGLLIHSAAAEGPAIVGWRLDGTGRYPGATPPAEWSAEKNVIWSTPMPAWGNASPILVGGKLFVQSEPTNLICVDAADGRILWTRSNELADVMTPADVAAAEKDKVQATAIREQMAPLKKQIQDSGLELARLTPLATQPEALATRPDLPKSRDALKQKLADLAKQVEALNAKLAPFIRWEKPPANNVNGYSSPTPTSDGKSVYALFGNGVAACYDLAGNRQWARRGDRSPIEDGISSSPLLVDGKLLLHINNLTALAPATGETIWVASNTEPSYGTPFAFELAGVRLVATANGDVVRVQDGRVLARRISLVSYCSPIAQGNVVYFFQNISKGHGGGHAVRLSPPADDKIKPQVLWQTKAPRERYYASPVLADGLIYAVNQIKVFSVTDAATGEVVYDKPLILGKGTTFPSICLAGGLLFVSHDSGQTAVLKPGRQFELLATNTLEPFRATPLFAGKRIFIRCMKKLYCIGTKE